MSYEARYWSTTGKRLIGDVAASKSEPWGDHADAAHYLANVLLLNGSGCDGKVVEVDVPPVHFRHCPDLTRPVTGVGDKCFKCGKLLTVEDAKAYKETAGCCVYADDTAETRVQAALNTLTQLVRVELQSLPEHAQKRLLGRLVIEIKQMSNMPNKSDKETL